MGKDQCWCSTAKISPEGFAGVPAEARDGICLCPRCAQKATAGTSNRGNTVDPRGKCRGGAGPEAPQTGRAAMAPRTVPSRLPALRSG